MCSDTERMEMLIVSHICSFHMSYDSIDISLRGNKTMVLYNQSRETYSDLSLGKFGSKLNYSFNSSCQGSLFLYLVQGFFDSS